MTTAELRSLEDLQRYTQSLAALRPEDDPRVRRMQFLKQTTWLFLLTLTFVGYHLLEKMGEALSLL
jgi:hypothetical protein